MDCDPGDVDDAKCPECQGTGEVEVKFYLPFGMSYPVKKPCKCQDEKTEPEAEPEVVRIKWREFI